MNEDTSSIQTVIQREPMVRVSVAWRRCSAVLAPDLWYWESWCFSDDPRLKSFMGGSSVWRGGAQRIHDGILRCVTKFLEIEE